MTLPFYCFIRFIPEIMDIDYISVKQLLHSHLSGYFCTFKINSVDICKIMLMVLTISDL